MVDGGSVEVSMALLAASEGTSLQAYGVRWNQSPHALRELSVSLTALIDMLLSTQLADAHDRCLQLPLPPPPPSAHVPIFDEMTWIL